MKDTAIIKRREHKHTRWQRFKRKILKWFRLSNQTMIKVYHGYGNASHLVVIGHVFSLSPVSRKRYRKNIWTNTFALLRSFMIKTIPCTKVYTIWEGKRWEVTTADDGFFRFEIFLKRPLTPGIHSVEICMDGKEIKKKYEWVAKSTGTIIIPHNNQFAFISDIDDTFLISHSASFWKKMYVLLTKNAHSRKPFEGVVKHYSMLAKSNSMPNAPNPFFYVSSSEWNLYDFISEFIKKNELPNGVLLLSQVKRFSEIYKTGSNRHATKFMRIARILEAYPNQQFVLFGDDSQQDPAIYASIVEHFPNRITCVYLRHVYNKNLENVEELIRKMEAKGIPCCHFTSSSEAIKHSMQLGLISAVDNLDNRVKTYP